MSSTEFPFIVDLKRAVESGQRITPEDISLIGQIECELIDFDAKLGELAVTPQSHLTMEDAQEIEEMETLALNKLPGAGSSSAQVRSIAERNDAVGLPPVSADADAGL
ncbi:hypothetical protein BDW67DRAFT_184672 [Aspergillus spinulosporus]